jgi:23S rRNA pseudouridine2605 synthase
VRPDHESSQNDESDTEGSLLRLQRVLASAGHGSRRECEALIQDGRVEVDGQVVTQLGTRVDPDTQKILVDGVRVKSQRMQYFAVNKPPGVVSTSRDPGGRTRVIDLIRSDSRVYNVGRLDKSSEGLILVTNDGELANRLTHPRYEIEKTYQVQTVGVPSPEQLEQLERGVYLAEGRAKAKSVRLLKRNRVGAILEIVLDEGKNREIRRLLARIGHKVTRLQRVAIGPLELGGLPVGQYRDLTREEIDALKKWRPPKTAGAPKRKSTKGTKGKPPSRFGKPKASGSRSEAPRKPRRGAARNPSSRPSSRRRPN